MLDVRLWVFFLLFFFSLTGGETETTEVQSLSHITSRAQEPGLAVSQAWGGLREDPERSLAALLSLALAATLRRDWLWNPGLGLATAPQGYGAICGGDGPLPGAGWESLCFHW